MRVFATLLIFVLVGLAGAGCGRNGVGAIGPGIPSPDGATRLCYAVDDAYAGTFTDRRTKLVDIWIKRGVSTNEVVLFSAAYKFYGESLKADVQWRSTNEVVVQVYDCGDGGIEKVPEERSGPSNHLATLVFCLDEPTGKFRKKN